MNYPDIPDIAFVSAWKTLTTVYKDAGEIRLALQGAGMRLGDWAAEILGKVPLPTTAETVEFIRLRVNELGFTEVVELREILKRGQERGLKPCLPSDGVAIRLGCFDQPMNEVLWLAMEPIKDSNGHWRVICVDRRVYGRWLGADYADLGGTLWSPKHELVFRK